eukprot:COSAG01_NODE_8682_length_2697_cov_23.461124_4_plen_74_part_00
MCGAVGQRDDNEGLTGALDMDVVVLRCGLQQEMREEELWVCDFLKTGGALSTCVIRHNHYPLSFSTPLTASTW